MEKITAILLSAGTGSRMHTDIPKQYLDLCGRPVIAWSVEALQKCPLIDDIILVAGRDDIDFCRERVISRYGFSKVTKIIPGGAERGESVLCGLEAADQDTTFVLIHDGARPLIDQNSITRIIDAVRIYRAAVLAVPSTDTVKVVDSEEMVVSTPDRKTLRMMQTPQAFAYPMILRAYQSVKSIGVAVTDDAMAAEHIGMKVKVVEGSRRNIKITLPEDLMIAELMMNCRAGNGEAT